jgi:hypothetical protein
MDEAQREMLRKAIEKAIHETLENGSWFVETDCGEFEVRFDEGTGSCLFGDEGDRERFQVRVV